MESKPVSSIGKARRADRQRALPFPVSGSAGQTRPKPLRWRGALLPVSVVGGFCGLIVGMLPATAWVLLFGRSFAPLFALTPVSIGLCIRLFRGYGGRRAVFLTGVFSLFGLYLTALSCRASGIVLRLRMPVYNVPLLTLLGIGSPDSLPVCFFSSGVVYPLLFAALGFMVARELLDGVKALAQASAGSAENSPVSL